MSINFNKISGVDRIYKSHKTEPKKGVQESSKVKAGKDEVQISKEAMDLQLAAKCLKAAHSLPDTREDVVAAIKEKMDKNTYSVDSKSLADKILTKRINIEA